MTESHESTGRDAPIEPGNESTPADQSSDGLSELPTADEARKEAPSGGAASSGTSSGQP